MGQSGRLAVEFTRPSVVSLVKEEIPTLQSGQAPWKAYCSTGYHYGVGGKRDENCPVFWRGGNLKKHYINCFSRGLSLEQIIVCSFRRCFWEYGFSACYHES